MVKTTKIDNPAKPWWEGDSRVEKYMNKISDAIERHVESREAFVDIYNRAYEAVYRAIKDSEPTRNDCELKNDS